MYSGDYGPDMTLEKLAEFHRRRMQVLAAAGPDILAFETIPSLLEAQVGDHSPGNAAQVVTFQCFHMG